MYCPKCGIKLGECARFCHKCGYRMPDSSAKTVSDEKRESPAEEWHISLHLFGETDTDIDFGFASHIQRFSPDLPSIALGPWATLFPVS